MDWGPRLTGRIWMIEKRYLFSGTYEETSKTGNSFSRWKQTAMTSQHADRQFYWNQKMPSWFKSGDSVKEVGNIPHIYAAHMKYIFKSSGSD